MIQSWHGSRSLVLIDGLPGTGKSTTAHWLCLHLTRQGRPARWYWELESPHPVFEFAEALDGDQLRGSFVDSALHNWKNLAADLASRTECVILESSFLQSAIHPMLALDWSEDRIAEYVQTVERTIAPLNPLLAVLRVSDVEATLRDLIAVRGTEYGDLLAARVSASPYGRARQLQGLDGLVRYVEAARDLTDALCRRLDMETVILETGRATVSFADRIGRALGLAPFVPFETDVADLARFTGAYTRVGTADACHVVTDGRHLYIDGAPPMQLVHRGGYAFEGLGTCVQYEFVTDGAGTIQRLACRGNFPDLAPDWVKSA